MKRNDVEAMKHKLIPLWSRKMETIKSSSTPSLNQLLLRSFTKVFRIPEDRIPKIKFEKKRLKDNENKEKEKENEKEKEAKIRNQLAMEAMFAKLFACVSSVKAAYAQLQISQSPYDPDGIQCADEMLVYELKRLSELKRSYLKKQVDPSPQDTLLLAELQEQTSLLKMYEITGKKLESQLKLKDSEITFLAEKLEECETQNRLLEHRIDTLESISIPNNLSLAELNINHFVLLLRYTTESIRSFARLLVQNIHTSGWDLVAAATSIETNVVHQKMISVLYVFESFVCRTMFEGFQNLKFTLSREGKQEGTRSHFFDRFMELKFKNVYESKPHSTFGKFCRVKYLTLIHPKLELAFFGDLDQRNMLDSGDGYPDTIFFATFAEMAKRVWLLHCLAFSFEPEASIFQVRKGCRFSEVLMENVEEDDPTRPIVDPRVGFTIIPGFKIAKTVIQCQVYLSSSASNQGTNWM